MNGPNYEPLLDVKHVSKRFDGLVANHGISLHVRRGEIVGLMGANGSGKSVLFGTISGQYSPDAGKVQFDGADITELNTAAIARLGLLRVYQHAQFYPRSSCLECMRVSVASHAERFGQLFRRYPREVDERADWLLNLFGLYECREVRAGELSYGQQKSLEISMALMSEPTLLLLDEPTAGIQPAAVGRLLDRLSQCNEDLGVTLLVIEHNMPALMSLAMRLYCMAGGEILAEGSPAAIRGNRAVIRAYLGRA